MTKRQQEERATRLRRIVTKGEALVKLTREFRQLIAEEEDRYNREKASTIHEWGTPAWYSVLSKLNSDSSDSRDRNYGAIGELVPRHVASARREIEELGAPVKHTRNRQRSKPAPDPAPGDPAPALFELFGPGEEDHENGQAVNIANL